MENELIFNRMMENIVRNNFQLAKLTAISDINKLIKDDSSYKKIMNANNSIELIKIMSSFSIMSEKIKEYNKIFFKQKEQKITFRFKNKRMIFIL